MDPKEVSRIEEVVDFWPDVFELGGFRSVRLRVLEIAPGDEERPIEEIRSEELVRLAQERVKQVEKFASTLDEAAMKLDFEQLKLFIAHYATYHSVKKASKFANGSLAAFKHRRRIDPIFDEMWVIARESWTDDLEEVGMQRATMDADCKTMAASNDMLKFMLKARSADHQDTVNVRHGGIDNAQPIEIKKTFDLEHLTDTVGILNEVLNSGG